MKNGQSQTAFCSCAAVVTRAACLASAALLFPFARPRLSRPDLFSNLKFEISNPLRPLSPLPSALGSVSGKTQHSPMATRIPPKAREYRLFGAVLSDSHTGRSNARHSPLATRPGLISNLKFEISNPLRPFSPLPSALGSVSGKTHHSPLATRISRNPREYRLFGAVLSDSRTGRSNAPATHHSPLTTRPGPISNLKFEISNPLRPFSPLPSAFSLSKCPSLIRKNPSLIPEYPPLARNIPPYPRISPPPILVRNQFQHNHIHHAVSNSPKTPSLITNHLHFEEHALFPIPAAASPG